MGSHLGNFRIPKYNPVSHKRMEKDIPAASKEGADTICKAMFSLNDGYSRILLGELILSHTEKSVKKQAYSWIAQF